MGIFGLVVVGGGGAILCLNNERGGEIERDRDRDRETVSFFFFLFFFFFFFLFLLFFVICIMFVSMLPTPFQTLQHNSSQAESFWAGMPACTFQSELPGLQSSVNVVGYPMGGRTICVTEGWLEIFDHFNIIFTSSHVRLYCNNNI